MTLIELMLAIALFSALLAAVTGLVRASLQAQMNWERQGGSSERMALALDRLERDFESAQRLFDTPMIGTANTFELARVVPETSPDRPTVPRWVRVRYRLEPDGNGALLVREEFARQPHGFEQTAQAHESLLHVASGQFRFGVLDAQGQFQWVTTWDGERHGLPSLVTLELTLPASGARSPLVFSRVLHNPAGTTPIMETP